MLFLGRQHSDIQKLIRIINSNLSDDENCSVQANSLITDESRAKSRSALFANLSNPEGHLLPLSILRIILDADKFFDSPSSSFITARKRLIRSLSVVFKEIKACKVLSEDSLRHITTAWFRCEFILGDHLAERSSAILGSIQKLAKSIQYLRESRTLEKVIPVPQLEAHQHRSILALEAVLQRIDDLNRLQVLPHQVMLPYQRKTFLQAACVSGESHLLYGLRHPIDASEEHRLNGSKLLSAFEALVSTVERIVRTPRPRLPSLNNEYYPDLAHDLGVLRERFERAYRSFQ